MTTSLVLSRFNLSEFCEKNLARLLIFIKNSIQIASRFFCLVMRVVSSVNMSRLTSGTTINNIDVA